MKNLFKTLLSILLLACSIGAMAQITCQANFSYTVSHDTVSFNNLSTHSNNAGATSSYEWQFGDGNISLDSCCPMHVYSAGGYTACLITYTYYNGNTVCADTFCQQIQITSNANCGSINGAWTYNQVSPTDTIHFTSSVDSTNWGNSWTLGDGSLATGPNPLHYYAQSGTYTACRIIAYNNGLCRDTVCQTVTVNNYCATLSGYWLDSLVQGTTYRFYATDTNTIAHHIWSFGDGSNDPNAMDTTHTFASGGTYHVCLYVYIPGSTCPTDSYCRNITVTSPCHPITDGQWAYSQVTYFDTIHFTVSVDSTDWSDSWIFGDGTTGQGHNPVHYYSHPGRYQVCRVIYMNNLGCSDTICDSITVTNYCATIIPTWTDTARTGTTVAFFATDTVSFWHRDWSFGDGLYGFGIDTTHTFATAGTYHVCLYTYGGNGCNDSLCTNIAVDTSFNCATLTGYWLDSITSGSTYRFYAIDTNTAAHHIWVFGDGSTDVNSRDTTHTYSANGTYTACLYVYIPGSNCPTDSLCRTVTVTGVHSVCTLTSNDAYYDYTSAQVISGDSFSFNSPIDSAGWNNNWTFGDGGTSHLQNPSHIFAPGTYTVCRYISDTVQGTVCRDSFCRTLTITAPCGYTLTSYWLDSLIQGTTYRFYASDTNSAAHHIWVFGDGSTSVNSRDTTHAYASPGTYVACLYVYVPGTSCATDSLCRDITVGGCGTASYYNYIENGDQILAYSNSIGTGNTTIYDWTVKNANGTVIQSQVNDTSRFLSNALPNGTYEVCLTLYNGSFRCDSFCKSISIFNRCANLNANWSWSQMGSTDTVKFESAVDSTTWTYSWRFGDGATSYYPNVSHYYAQPGTYTVCLIAGISSLSCYDTICKSVTVTGAPNCGTAAFSDYIYGDTSIHAYSTSTNNPTGTIYAWYIYGPNGNLVQSQSGTNSYIVSIALANGTYNVCEYLYTANNLFCDSICESIVINNSTSCAGLTASWTQTTLSSGAVQFTPADTNHTVTHYWVFGDGTTSQDVSPTHSYANGGYYHVCQYVSITGTACYDSSCTNIQARAANCQAGFTFYQASNANLTIIFTSTSTSADTITSYSWYFGDNTSDTGANVHHTFADSGKYYVCLRIGTSNGCVSYFCDTVHVISYPCTGLTANWTSTVLQNGNIQFHATDTSTTVTHYWKFGDGTPNGTGIDPIHAYAQAGTYRVCLYAYIPGTNCFDSICNYVTVNASTCSAGFTYQSYFPPYNSVNFTNTSTSSDSIISYYWEFGDNSSGTFKNGSHTYPHSGYWYTCLYITTLHGCTSSYCDSVYVQYDPCYGMSASYTYSYTNSGGVHFVPSVNTNANFNLWIFGDGTTSTNNDPTHYYTQSGSYTVCHITGVQGSCADTSCQTIQGTGTGTGCQASFTYATDTLNNHAYFTNTSTSSDSILSYYWTFGDDSTSTLKTPYHNYASPGTYYVCLTISTANGCTNTWCDSVKVRVNTISNNCAASFTSMLDTCQTLAFTNTSTGGYTREYWSFGDGSAYDTAADPTHLFPVGTWTVTLEVYGTNCQSAVSETVSVAACGNVGNDTICGTVFYDLNGNGIQDTSERGVPNAEIHIGNFVTHADSNGHYQIVVPAGTYTIYYCAPTGYTFSIPVNSYNPNTNTTCSVYQNIQISSGTNCGFNFGIILNNVTICGTVYFDINDDHNQDPGDPGIPGARVVLKDSATGDSTVVYTDQYGHYCAIVPTGVYTVTASSSQYSTGTVYPSSINVEGTTAGLTYSNNNFGIYVQSGDCNLTITVSPNTNVKPGYPAWYHIEVCNVGTNVTSAQVNMFYDPGLTFNYSSPAPTSQNTSSYTLTWDLNNLLPGSCQYYWISLQADSNLTLGQSIFTLVTVIPTTCNDTNFNNMVDTLHQAVSSSWDPNSKTVSPIGQGADGAITDNQALTYTVGFQNTGNAPAVNIVVHDTISNNLDLRTFRMLGASAPFTFQMIGRVAVWKFNGIMLPDSTTDPQGSLGSVSFMIQPLQGLAQGTQITNTGNVYFDYNAGVSTNTTLNTIDYTLSVKDLTQTDVTITLQPNPFNDFTVIRIQGADAPYEMKIFDMMGQLVSSEIAGNNTIIINRNNLSSGVYMYQLVKDGKLLGTGKMVAQ